MKYIKIKGRTLWIVAIFDNKTFLMYDKDNTMLIPLIYEGRIYEVPKNFYTYFNWRVDFERSLAGSFVE